MVPLYHSTVGKGLPVTVKSNRIVLPSATLDDTGLAVTPALTGYSVYNMRERERERERHARSVNMNDILCNLC
jgi:hypothetical protein